MWGMDDKENILVTLNQMTYAKKINISNAALLTQFTKIPNL